MESAHRIAVVVRGDLASKVLDLVGDRHVWAVRAPDTEEVARRVWSDLELNQPGPLEVGLTLFNPGATPEESLLSVLATVELHHGAYSHVPPVSMIDVLGIDVTDAIREEFAALGFTQISPSECGFVAVRAAA